MTRRLGIAVSLSAASILIAACSQRSDGGAASAPATTASSGVRAPALSDARPLDYAGLHNVVAYLDGLYSGSAPEGDAGFQTLAGLGVRTIISVDGAAPDVERARAAGMRYVHLPIGYDGMDESRRLKLARAVLDLPGPIYLHCHHGKHRSAGAAGAVGVSLGRLTPQAAAERMRVSGTAANYVGLYRCVSDARPASREQLDAADASFPEVWKTSGLVRSMVAMDEVVEHLRLVETAGWATPADHPDLVAAAEAGQLAELLRLLSGDESARERPADYLALMKACTELAQRLEDEMMRGAAPVELSRRLRDVDASCKDCHVRFRD